MTQSSALFRTGRLDLRRAIDHWKAHGLDYSRLLYQPEVGPEVAVYRCEVQDHGLAGGRLIIYPPA